MMTHTLYLLIVFPMIILINWALHFVKNKTFKDWILVVLALAPFLIEWTIVYKTYLNNKGANTGLTWVHLFPVYFCTLIMVLLVVVAAWPHKNSKVFNCLATFVAWSAIFGGAIGNLTIFFNFTISDFSHSCMVLVGIYMFVAGYAKINVYNLIPFSFGLLFTGVVGATTRKIFVTHNFDVSGTIGNCMFMYKGIPGFEFLNGYILALILLVAIFLITSIWEFFTKKKEDRWYKNISDLWLYLPKFNKTKKTIIKAESNKTTTNVEVLNK